ncbi:hypothetical protein K438DRAFT_342502 [Mycena galopus ATCC 62051]|nr:hypothetical protein K438DRAFT_342502 [Mycena galopus ATCC 62051]
MGGSSSKPKQQPDPPGQVSSTLGPSSSTPSSNSSSPSSTARLPSPSSSTQIPKSPEASPILSNPPASSHSFATSPSFESSSVSESPSSSNSPPSSLGIASGGRGQPTILPSADSSSASPSLTSRPGPTISAQNSAPQNLAENRPPTTGEIVGIVVAILFMTVAVILFWLWRRRRRSRNPPTATLPLHVPAADSLVSQGPTDSSRAAGNSDVQANATTMRRRYLADELLVALEKSAAVIEMERRVLTLPTAADADAPGGHPHASSGPQKSNLILLLRERNEALAARIHHLEEHMWRGLSEESPPGYIA